MLTGLLASARELRNPLTVGYSALLAFWLVAGEEVRSAAHDDALGRRLLAALNSMGDGATLALYTFAAAMIGSLLWNGGVSRLVRFLSVRARHPDWNSMIEEAKEAVRRYEEYQVTTYKAPSPNGKLSTFDQRHRVPSSRHAAYLHDRVDERERKAAEMSFRVTLAVALVPVAVALGVEGDGLWWLSLCAIPVVWLDVALMKHTALRVVRRYQLEDLQSKLEDAERMLESARSIDPQRGNYEDQTADADAYRQEQFAELGDEINAYKAAINRLRDDEARRLSRLFAFFEGQPAD